MSIEPGSFVRARPDMNCPIVTLPDAAMEESWVWGEATREFYADAGDRYDMGQYGLPNDDPHRKYAFSRGGEHALAIDTGLELQTEQGEKPDVKPCLEARLCNHLRMGHLNIHHSAARTVGEPETGDLDSSIFVLIMPVVPGEMRRMQLIGWAWGWERWTYPRMEYARGVLGAHQLPPDKLRNMDDIQMGVAAWRMENG